MYDSILYTSTFLSCISSLKRVRRCEVSTVSMSPERNATEQENDLVVGLIKRLSDGSRGGIEVVVVEARRQEWRRKSIYITALIRLRCAGCWRGEIGGEGEGGKGKGSIRPGVMRG